MEKRDRAKRLQAEASAAMQRKEWPTAAIALRELTRVVPHEARVWIELSYVESLLGHYRSARAAIEAAARLPQLGREDLADLVTRLRTFNDANALRHLALGLMRAPSPDPGLLGSCAAQLSHLNDHELALACARKSVALDPSGIGARMTRGQMLAQHGDIAGAAADFQWCLDRAPGIGAVWWALARLERQTATSNHVAPLRALLATQSHPPANAAYAAFALHKELDDIGDVQGAWQALELACTLKRAHLAYSMEESRRLVDALIALPTGTAAEPRAGGATKTPIFIIGMHRSGTTLLEQLLDAHPQVRGVGELYDFTSAMREATDHHCQGVIDPVIVERAHRLDFAEVGRHYLDGIAWRLGQETHFTDKLPSNFLNAGFICQALPQAKILHMVRDPVETCFSNLRELFSAANPYSYDQLELADYFIQYRRLVAHWRAACPGRIFDVDYGMLTADPAAVMKEVAAFCGLDYRPAMSDTRSSKRAVATASAIQVREGVVRRDRPKWAPYARELQPLIGALRQGGVDLHEPPP